MGLRHGVKLVEVEVVGLQSSQTLFELASGTSFAEAQMLSLPV